MKKRLSTTKLSSLPLCIGQTVCVAAFIQQFIVFHSTKKEQDQQKLGKSTRPNVKLFLADHSDRWIPIILFADDFYFDSHAFLSGFKQGDLILFTDMLVAESNHASSSQTFCLKTTPSTTFSNCLMDSREIVQTLMAVDLNLKQFINWSRDLQNASGVATRPTTNPAKNYQKLTLEQLKFFINSSLASEQTVILTNVNRIVSDELELKRCLEILRILSFQLGNTLDILQKIQQNGFSTSSIWTSIHASRKSIVEIFDTLFLSFCSGCKQCLNVGDISGYSTCPHCRFTSRSKWLFKQYRLTLISEQSSIESIRIQSGYLTPSNEILSADTIADTLIRLHRLLSFSVSLDDHEHEMNSSLIAFDSAKHEVEELKNHLENSDISRQLFLFQNQIDLITGEGVHFESGTVEIKVSVLPAPTDEHGFSLPSGLSPINRLKVTDIQILSYQK